MHHDNNKSKLIDDFVKNTLTDKQYANEVLEKNGWDLKRAYASMEKMCKDRNTANHYCQGGHTLERQGHISDGQGYDWSAGGLESGYGVPLNRSSNMPSSSYTPPLQRSSIPKFPVKPIQMDGSGPGSSHTNERIVQVLGSSNSSSPKYRTVITESYPLQSQPRSQGFTIEKSLKERTPPPHHQQQPPTNYNEQPVTTNASVPKSEPKLKRGISNIMENASLLTETRSCVLHDIEEDSHDHMYILTFVLPDLTIHNDGFRAFLQKELVETSTLVSLEQAGRLNWWAEMRICQRLWPMATTGDGNCLLHAASLAMWGVHDRQLILRNALYDKLTNSSYRDALYRRWRWQQNIANKESGLVFSETEWTEEWGNLLKLASTKPRTLPDQQESNRRHSCCDSVVTHGSDTPVVYESLEEFHVFVLSHVLERPIIIVADKVLKDSSGEALAPIPFGGIYLPLECSRFYRSPLLLTYDAAHFSALVPMEQKNPTSTPAAIPLVDPDFNLLSIHFHLDPGAKYDWLKPPNKTFPDLTCEDKLNHLQKFMDCEKLLIPHLYNDNDVESDKNSVGSYDSDDNVGCVSKGEKKKNKQMNIIGKQFGSIGKSVGKKFKKNFGNFGKNSKAAQDDDKLNNCKPLVGSIITQSTKVITTIATASDKDRVWCAKLSTRRADNQHPMVKNYMQNAGERYEKDRELKRQKGEELRSRVSEISQNANQNICVTPGCNLYGTPEFSYMCSQCFHRQKSQIDDIEEERKKAAYNTFPGRGRQTGDIFVKQGNIQDDTYIYKHGKSKFYTIADDPCRAPEPSCRISILNNLEEPKSVDDVKTLNQSKPLLPADRTPSPNYDNVDYSTQQTSSALSNVRKCFFAGCQFFGKPETDNLCSACYKEKSSLANTSRTSTRI